MTNPPASFSGPAAAPETLIEVTGMLEKEHGRRMIPRRTDRPRILVSIYNDGTIVTADDCTLGELTAVIGRMRQFSVPSVETAADTTERIRALCGRALSGDRDKRSLLAALQQIVEELP